MCISAPSVVVLWQYVKLLGPVSCKSSKADFIFLKKESFSKFIKIKMKKVHFEIKIEKLVAKLSKLEKIVV